jgi:type IV secretory pathway VirB10-like protein
MGAIHRFEVFISVGCLSAGIIFAQERAQNPTTTPGVAPFELPLAQPEKPAAPVTIPLAVQAGVPLDVILESKLKITKQTGAPVRGRLVEPVYVFDHTVIPAGSELLGHVSRVDTLSRKQRAWHIADGDFTHFRKVHLDFDTLLLKDGTQLPVHTAVHQGALETVHLSAGDQGKKKGRVGQTVDQAKQEVKNREQQAIQEAKAPRKSEHVKAWLVSQLPYHPESLPAGTHFTAELKQPLDLGVEDQPQQPPQPGAPIPPGSEVHVRLLTALSSATDQQGSHVLAVVSEPLFSPQHQLILPEGTRLEGSVTQAVPARRMGRNGQLRFVFRQIDPAQGAPQRVEASLQSVDAATSPHMKLDSEGGAHAVTPKTHYIEPAIDVFLAAGSLDGLDPHNHKRIEEGLGPQGPDVAGGAIKGRRRFRLGGQRDRNACPLPPGERRLRLLRSRYFRVHPRGSPGERSGFRQEHAYGDQIWNSRGSGIAGPRFSSHHAVEQLATLRGTAGPGWLHRSAGLISPKGSHRIDLCRAGCWYG